MRKETENRTLKTIFFLILASAISAAQHQNHVFLKNKHTLSHIGIKENLVRL